jgi:hypothetical protein
VGTKQSWPRAWTIWCSDAASFPVSQPTLFHQLAAGWDGLHRTSSITRIPLEYSEISVVLSIVLWMIASPCFKSPAYLAIYSPHSLALLIAVAIRSLFQTAPVLRGGKTASLTV